MNYLTEARRLGVRVPLSLILNDSGDGLRYIKSDRPDGMCVTGCYTCRDFRNKVRKAQQAEQDKAREAERVINQSEENLREWRRERKTLTYGIGIVNSQLMLLPQSPLIGRIDEAANLLCGLIDMAWSEEYERQRSAHEALLSGESVVGAASPRDAGAAGFEALLADYFTGTATVVFDPTPFRLDGLS